MNSLKLEEIITIDKTPDKIIVTFNEKYYSWLVVDNHIIDPLHYLDLYVKSNCVGYVFDGGKTIWNNTRDSIVTIWLYARWEEPIEWLIKQLDTQEGSPTIFDDYLMKESTLQGKEIHKLKHDIQQLESKVYHLQKRKGR